jgi:hypothetical protein
MKKLVWMAACSATFMVASQSAAHLWLTDPPARHPADDLKYGPCGVGTPDSRTTDPDLITTYSPGETITLTWIETIDHDPSHFRVAFSEFGDTEFVDPTGYDDIGNDYPIVLDGIADADAGAGHEYQVQVTLPNIQCDSCTLQVIQVMHDKPPWGPGGGDDIYYQCADIVLEGDLVDNPVGSGGTGTEPPGSGGTTGEAPQEPTNDPLAPEDEPSRGGGSTTRGPERANCSQAGAVYPSGLPAWLFVLLSGVVIARAARRVSHER